MPRFYATAPRGLADLAALELQAQGADGLQVRGTLLTFEGPLEIGYRACLWSRVLDRVLLELTGFEAADADAFYEAARRFDWAAHIDPARTLACDFSGTHPTLHHSRFGALRLKDAVCDRLREQLGRRPDIAPVRAAVRLHAHARGTHLTLALDLAGEGLHRRGYRLEAGAAPLRENLAAGVLLRARWPALADESWQFLDPMCGSGTLVIEAALIAARRAPGLSRAYFGFLGWRQHDAALWQRLCDQAREQARQTLPAPVRGSDVDPTVLEVARANAARAGVASLVGFERRGVSEAQPAEGGPGLVCTNPPYGERLGDVAQAARLHAELGASLRSRFPGWQAAILTATAAPTHALALRSYRVHELSNGAIACRLLRIDLAAPGAENAAAARLTRTAAAAQRDGARMFANRLTKNRRHLERQARRQGVSCYRLYDADMPEYAFAIDRYEAREGGAVHLLVQEYAAPASVDVDAARLRRDEVLAVLPQVLEVPPEHLHLRLRQRQRGAGQYQRRTSGGRGDAPGLIVSEAGLALRVNLDDYLDTGLFLDERLVRARLAAVAAGRRLLNLFCYTASASVHAAAGGAVQSLSIDLSARYLAWAEQNYQLNALDRSRHRLLRADCAQWLANSGLAAEFDLIFLAPPTFSNSRRMQGVLDLQRDHAGLVERCMALLAPGGLLLFSTNAQRFRLDPQIATRYRVTDTSRAMLPFDFQRHPHIHRCFEIVAR